MVHSHMKYFTAAKLLDRYIQIWKNLEDTLSGRKEAI